MMFIGPFCLLLSIFAVPVLSAPQSKTVISYNMTKNDNVCSSVFDLRGYKLTIFTGCSVRWRDSPQTNRANPNDHKGIGDRMFQEIKRVSLLIAKITP